MRGASLGRRAAIGQVFLLCVLAFASRAMRHLAWPVVAPWAEKAFIGPSFRTAFEYWGIAFDAVEGFFLAGAAIYAVLLAAFALSGRLYRFLRPARSGSQDGPSEDALTNGGASGALAVLLLFVLSVGVRLPHIVRPLSDHHENVTSQSLIVLQSWYRGGAWAEGFCLRLTMTKEADRFCRGPENPSVVDHRGVGYYTSFPPFSIVFAHAFFALVGGPPEAALLRGLQLLLHGWTSWLLYRGLVAAFRESPARTSGDGRGNGLAAVAGAAVFIFSPSCLWNLSNIYSWDVFWIHLWVPAIGLSLAYRERLRSSRPVGVVLFGLGTVYFLLTFSAFHGALLAGLTSAVFLGTFGWSRAGGAFAAVTLGAAILAGLVTVALYSRIDGCLSLLVRLADAAGERSILHLDGRVLGRIVLHNGLGFLPAWLLLLSAGLQRSRPPPLPRVVRFVLVSTFGYALLHQLLLAEHSSTHDFAAAQMGIPLAFLVGAVVARSAARRSRLGLALLLAMVWASVGLYEEYFAASPDPGRFERLGRSIAALARDEEVVFVSGPARVDSPVVPYAGRSIQLLSDPAEAAAWLVRHDREAGVVFVVDSGLGLVRVVRWRREP